jgi:lysozyme
MNVAINIPEKAIEIVKHFEGIRLIRYNDVIGFPTIGYGHLCKPNDGLIEITQEQADDLLMQDLQIAASAVNRLTSCPLNNNQFAALIDFVFNLGVGSYQASTLRMVINRGDLEDVPAQFNRWVYGNGTKIPGLVARRKAEADLFFS